ncbi:DUF2804 domain-containing protein [Shewanella intestini]|uniref:DUF2804 domain-containing protein n=2 Tax=Shewanellaceae TaxID=267890 RepID=A0ABS5HXA4_9GAMM|nr:DUF2804 domain-containing protein [Shewanella intestini]MRG35052.1 DUF2804 family protein [Shewanella sp. XMDDZSB0408]
MQALLAPKRLMDQHGRPHYGHFDGVVESLALDEFRYFTEMDKPAGTVAQYFNYKQFQFFTLNTQRYIISGAIADIRYLASGFLYVFDIKRNKLVERTWLRPPKIGYHTEPSPFNGHAHIGCASNGLRIHIQQGLWHINIQTPMVSAKLTLTPAQLSLPMSLCTPTAYSGWTYTQKHNGLAVSGKLTVEHEPQPLNQALGSYDFSAGYMRRETSWRWASFNAHTATGVVGANFAAGVNETGANENVFWVDGKRFLVGAMHFEFSRLSPIRPWKIHSACGQVALRFKVVSVRKEQLNLGLLKSNFRQFIGYFDGVLIDEHQQQHVISHQLGLCEDHYAKW